MSEFDKRKFGELLLQAEEEITRAERARMELLLRPIEVVMLLAIMRYFATAPEYVAEQNEFAEAAISLCIRFLSSLGPNTKAIVDELTRRADEYLAN